MPLSRRRVVSPAYLVAAALFACDSEDMPAQADTSDVADADTLTPDAADSTPDSAADASDITPDSDVADADLEPRDFTARGPHRVGYRVGAVTYQPADGSGPRTLRLAAWYPTDAEVGSEVRYLGLLPSPEVLGDAPPAALGPRPVLLFSHGNTSFAEQSFFLTEFFASHGYLVVAPDHTGNTYGEPLSVEILHWRPDDVRGVLDHLEALGDAADPLAALAPLVSDKVVVSGHSFGGYTTLAAGGAAWDVDLIKAYCNIKDLPFNGCDAVETWEDMYRAGFLDPRVDALIPLSPGAVALFGLDGPDDVTLPTLLMTGARDATTPNRTDGDPAWAGLAKRAHNLRVDFANAGHFTFSNACQLAEVGFPIGISDGCGDTFLAPERAFTAINAYALAFAEYHLRGRTDGLPLLTGEQSIEPDATLSFGAR